MEKLKQVIVFLLKNSGKSSLSPEDFPNILSFGKNWIEPEMARKLFQICIDAGLLEERDGSYFPTFEISGFILPLDFSVTEEDVKKYSLGSDVFTEILDHICSSSGMERRDVIMEVNSIKKEMEYVTIEVAALILCKEMGIDCSKFYRRVEEKIKSS